MGKIHDGETILNKIQVINALTAQLPDAHASIIACNLHTDSDPRKTMVYAMIEAYKHLPTQTEEDTKIKKYALYLVDKYMKSPTVMDGETEAYQSLLERITQLK